MIKLYYGDGKMNTVDKINFEALRKRAQLAFITAWEIANRPDRLVVDKTDK